MYEQMNMFDFFKGMEAFDPDEYLRKGEKILSLARSKKMKNIHMESSVLDCINASTYKKRYGSKRIMYAVGRIADCYVKNICMAISEQDDKNMDLLMKLIPDDIRDEIKICFAAEGSYEERLMQAFFQGNKYIKAQSILISVGTVTFLGALNGRITPSKHRVKCRLRGANVNGVYRCVDVPRLIAEAILFGELKRRLIENDSCLGSWIKAECNQMIQKHLVNGVLHVNKKVVENDVFLEWQKQSQIPFVKEDRRGITDIFYPWLLQNNFSFSAICQMDFFRKMNSLYDYMIEESFKDIEVRQYLSVSGEHAKVWQDKKNIPDKVVKAMSESRFNDHFGYIELDSDCDLSKVEELEKEFRALNCIFHQEKREDVVLRFRKLGNHKALGLYFPSLQCLCVDLRSPSSMAHEYFHMLDHLNGFLCRKAAFFRCEYLYKKAFQDGLRALKVDSPERKQMEGSSKYNMDYYLQPMEIFARCGELYLTRIKKVSNSLCVPKEGIAYPENEELLYEIKRYFDEMFCMFEKRASIA